MQFPGVIVGVLRGNFDDAVLCSGDDFSADFSSNSEKVLLLGKLGVHHSFAWTDSGHLVGFHEAVVIPILLCFLQLALCLNSHPQNRGHWSDAFRECEWTDDCYRKLECDLTAFFDRLRRDDK